MFAASCMIVGLKKHFYESDKTDPGGEFFNEKESSVRRKITAVEIKFDLLIAFKRNGV